ncbi:hypothetical protein [Streptomyces tremellae]
MERTWVPRAVRGTGRLTEQVPPVLLPTDTARFGDGTPVPYGEDAGASAEGLVVRRGGTSVTVEWGRAPAATVEATDVTLLRGGARRIHVLRVPHGGTLTTVVRAG